jgi:hypothetical protein
MIYEIFGVELSRQIKLSLRKDVGEDLADDLFVLLGTAGLPKAAVTASIARAPATKIRFMSPSLSRTAHFS